MYPRQALRQLLVAMAMSYMAQAVLVDRSGLTTRALIERQDGGGGGGGGGDNTKVAPTPTRKASSVQKATDVVVGASSAETKDTAVTKGPTAATDDKASSLAQSSPSSATPSTIATQTQNPAPPNKETTQPPSMAKPGSPGVISTTSVPNAPADQTDTGSTSQIEPAVTSAPTRTTMTTKVETMTSTGSDGSVQIVTTTITSPALNTQNPDGGDTGMSRKTRNTVIGVVVGVGGAIVLATLGFVAWRIWGRKRYNEENDVLMDYDMSAGMPEKSERGSSAGGVQRSPFQSTLETYHRPGHANPSSNF